jgi:hypothetical protein
MARKKAQLTFVGLDTDVADKYLQKGSYRDALNIRIGSSEENNTLSVENVKGNTLVSYALPSGTNTVIGAHEDIVNKCVYYFLCNEYELPQTQGTITYNGQFITIQNNDTTNPSGIVDSDLVRIGYSTNDGDKWIVSGSPTGTLFRLINPSRYITSNDNGFSGTFVGVGSLSKFGHSILKYDIATNSISLVYKHSRLDFDPNYPITGTALINNTLCWTDGHNPPRALNLTECASYGTYFVETAIDFIRTPPSIPATCVSSLVSNTENFFEDKSFQFIYRYVYKDDSYSVWSPISEMIPTGYLSDKKNRIVVTINNDETQKFNYYSKIIKGIELAFRDGDTLNFKYITRLSFPNATSVSYTFLNDRTYSVIDSAETSHLFESIPVLAGALAPVSNRIFLGDCTEGFDVNTSDFSIGSITYDVPTTPTKNKLSIKSGTIEDLGIVFYDRAQRRSSVTKLSRINTQIPGVGFGSPSTRAIGATIKFKMNGKPPIWATRYQFVKSKNLVASFFLQGLCIVCGPVVNFTPSAKKTKILFNGLNGKISYVPVEGDYLRIIKPIQNDDSTSDKYKILKADGQYIIVEGEVPITKAGGFNSFGLQACEIYSKANDDGLFYEISESYPVIAPHTEIRSFDFSNAAPRSISTGNISVRNLDETPYYNARLTVKVTSLKFITTDQSIIINGHTFTSKYVPGWNSTTVAYDLVSQINSFGVHNAAFITDFYDTFNTRDTSPETNASVFIVYSKVKGSGGNAVYGGSTQLGTTGIFLMGQTSGNGAQNNINNTFFECMSPTDNAFETWNKNIGRPNQILVSGDKQVRRKELIRFGGVYITGTQLNNNFFFQSLDQKELTNAGALRKLITAANNQAEGTIMLAIQESEISSVYIGQTMIKNAGGGQNLATSNDVIGSVNPLQKLVGTVNPESVVQFNGLVYGFDALRGIVWRYGQDGLNFISEQISDQQATGMKNFFYKRSRYLISLGTSFKCFAGIDPFHNEYILSIPNSDSEKITIAWSEKVNRWTSFRSFVGDWYQKINTNFISFKNGALWLHDNPVFGNFYGTQYDSWIVALCNQDPDSTKILQTVEEVASGGQWDCSDITTPGGQSSELIGLYNPSSPNDLPADFRSYEDTYSANVMRDKNTPNMEASDYPLLRGDLIRDKVFSIKLKNNKTSQQNLYFVNLFYIDSYKT